MPTGPPDPSPPVEADFGPSHDAITAELLDLTWQFLTHAAPTVRAELGQFLTDHGQHPVAGLGAFHNCLQLSAARHHPGDAHGERTPPRSTSGGQNSLTQHATAQRRWGQYSFPPGPEVVLENHRGLR
jgi:hypothetical protein